MNAHINMHGIIAQIPVEKIKEMAKGVLKRDGYHVPMASITLKDGKTMLCTLTWDDDEEKHFVFNELSAVIKAKAESYVFIMDGAMRKIDFKDGDFVEENYDTERPLTYPESMRTEVLIIHDVNRHGKCDIHMIEYKYNDKRKLIIGKEIKLTAKDDMEGLMVNFFK